MPHALLAAYLQALLQARASGVAETSNYTALFNLLDGVGSSVRPGVRAIPHPQNIGVGIPDAGLFTIEQLRDDEAKDTQIPARGVVEVKGTAEALHATINSEQVGRYLGRYGQVLVTNLWSFALVEAVEGATQPRIVEEYALAPNEAIFWREARRTAETAEQHGERLVEFLRRTFMRRARLSTPKDVAVLLASYAKEARLRLDSLPVNTPALSNLRTALKELLGVDFAGNQGEHFFRATLVQTLFYGLFSVWVIHHELQVARAFDWRAAAHELSLPVIQRLFTELTTPQAMRGLGLSVVMDWATEALERINRDQFLTSFRESSAIQYFYEDFLEAYDPVVREQFGVWYTPPEVVKYMVERVDTVLREELGIPMGLADDNVFVLDPCTGTGSFLLEVIQRIHTTLEEEGLADAFSGSDLKEAAKQRLFGFAIMPAPFVVAHLKLSLLLKQLGSPLQEDERLRVYLTNALTGWREGEHPQLADDVPEFLREWEAASEVKQRKPVLVVMGNPPYNSFAGMAVSEERELTTAYRETVHAPRPVGQGLNDLYVRFYRMAERQIVERTQRGVVCYISNSAWLDGLSFTGMREKYLRVFDRIWIDNLNGDRYRTGKLTPDGHSDPSVFSTTWNREGIQIGTAVALMVRNEAHEESGRVQYRDLWGTNKLNTLLETAQQSEVDLYGEVTPELQLGLPFRPTNVQADYLTWPTFPDLFPVSFAGIKTSRDSVLVDTDRERLEDRMSRYFDRGVPDSEIAQEMPSALAETGRFDGPAVRRYLSKRGIRPPGIVPFAYRPFDTRWLYWESETKLLDEKRAEYVPHVVEGNKWIATQQMPRRGRDAPQVVSVAGCIDLLDRSASFFPLYIHDGLKRFKDDGYELKPNLSSRAAEYLQNVGVASEALFHHALAVMHAPLYREENDGALRQDWPRIPLPTAPELLESSALLGQQVAQLLDPQSPFVAPANLRALGRVVRSGGGTPMPADMAVTARWGVVGRGGVTMPGRGKLEETEVPVDPQLGARAYRIYLNDTLYLDNVPEKVWEYVLGGYQVIKKWLSYREAVILGRPLTVEEVREVTRMVQRIAALLLLSDDLNANYRLNAANE